MKRIILKRADCKRATFRAGGKGGQHQNKTDSAVRWTHEPTGIAAESRTDRSQFVNDKVAWALLQAKLDKLVEDANAAEARAAYGAKADPGFGGQQIRSYVLDRDKRVVDHRTDHAETNVRDVLRGRIDGFVRATMEARI